MSGNGARVEAIWLKAGRRGRMEPVDTANMVKDVGLEGNADRGGYRQVTMLDADAWETATGELGMEVDPASRRANLLVRGIDLTETTGRVLRVADCRVEIRGETLPCDRMDAAAEGLKVALGPNWRAGAYGMVIEGGRVSVGDTVTWDE